MSARPSRFQLVTSNTYSLEPTINGMLLRDRLSKHERATFKGNVSAFATAELAAILLFDGPAPLPGDRRPILVCPCGDLLCCNVSARLEREGSVIHWRELGVSDSAEDSPHLFVRVTEFTFDWEQYRHAIVGARHGRPAET